jgi:glutaredoxin 3
MAMLETPAGDVISLPMFTIYTTSAFVCPYCVRAKAKLTELGHPFREIDIADPKNRDELMTRRPGVRTVPQIFAGNEYIGGCDDLFRLIEQDVLDLLIETTE